MEKIKSIIYLVFAYLGIETETFGILMALMTIDSVAGAIKSVRMGREFSIKTLLWGFSMKLCFLIIPLVVALMGKAVGFDFRSAVNIVIAILSVGEGYSILGNIYSAKNKVEIKKLDIISMLIISLRRAMSNTIKAYLSKLENINKVEKYDGEK